MSWQPTTMRAMPRPATGTIVRNQTRLGTSYGLRFSYRGEKVYHHVGGSWEGWTEERVEAERVHVMGQVQRGEYVPPQRAPAPRPAGDERPTFQVFASIVLARKKRRVAAKTYKDLEWRLVTAMDDFGSYRLDEIDAGVAERFRREEAGRAGGDRGGGCRRSAAEGELRGSADRADPSAAPTAAVERLHQQGPGRGASGAQGGQAPATHRSQPPRGSRVLLAVVRASPVVPRGSPNRGRAGRGASA